MTYELLLMKTMHRTGVDDPEVVQRSIESTIRVLGQRLRPLEKDMLAKLLPDRLARELIHQGYDAPFSVHDFYVRVAEDTGLRLGFAKEHAEVICEIIAEILDDESYEALYQALPTEWMRLMTPYYSSRSSRTQRQRNAYNSFRRTLASGRGGSTNPLYEG